MARLMGLQVAAAMRYNASAMTRTIDITPPSDRSRLAGPMTYEQFLEWDGENQHVEWVNGEVIPMPPVSDEHD